MKTTITIAAIIILFIAAVVSWAYLTRPSHDMIMRPSIFAPPSTRSPQAVTWKIYKDDLFDFSLEYPGDWTASVQVDNADQPDFVIKRSISFTGPKGPRVILSVWTNNKDLAIMEWFRAYAAQLVPSTNVPEKPNAVIAGSEALRFYSPQQPQAADEFVAVFKKVKRYFMIEYMILDQEKSQDDFDHMCASFK